MLRDRGFEIGDDEIEETYEEFEKKYLAKSSMLSFVTKEQLQVTKLKCTMASQLMQLIYVKFVKKEEKLSQEQVREIVLFMSSYSIANKLEDM